MKDEEIYTVRDVGPYPIYSTVLLTEDPTAADDVDRRTRLFFNYAIGGTVSGSGLVRSHTALAATPLETNMRVANMLVDEEMNVTSVDIAIPRVSQSIYQHNPDAGAYEVTEKDVAAIAAAARCRVFCGGEKPFVEGVLAHRPIIPIEKQKLPQDLPPIFRAVGGWTTQVADMAKMPLSIRHIEKFWAALDFPRELPRIGRHAYNPAVIPVAMIFYGDRVRRVS